MDKKPHYERGYNEASDMSLTVSEEGDARQSSGDRNESSRFHGSSTLEDWQRKSYTHEQWWNKK